MTRVIVKKVWKKNWARIEWCSGHGECVIEERTCWRSIGCVPNLGVVGTFGRDRKGKVDDELRQSRPYVWGRKRQSR